MQENDCEVVIKLPVNPSTDFDKGGICSLENEYDHTQRISTISDIDHSLVSRPVDGLSIRGQILAFGKFGGQDLFHRHHFNSSNRVPFMGYSDRETFAPERIADLIKVYMEIYRANIPTLSYGSPHNTRLIEEGKALALFDLCSQPPLAEHDAKQLYLQQKLFGKNVLACALFQALGNGNINLLVQGQITSKFRTMMSQGNSLARFDQYREKLLIESLQVLLDRGIIARDELLVNLELLRDVNDRMNSEILEYLKFKDHGEFMQLGQDLMQRLIEHFKN